MPYRTAATGRALSLCVHRRVRGGGAVADWPLVKRKHDTTCGTARRDSEAAATLRRLARIQVERLRGRSARTVRTRVLVVRSRRGSVGDGQQGQQAHRDHSDGLHDGSEGCELWSPRATKTKNP